MLGVIRYRVNDVTVLDKEWVYCTYCSPTKKNFVSDYKESYFARREHKRSRVKDHQYLKIKFTLKYNQSLELKSFKNFNIPFIDEINRCLVFSSLLWFVQFKEVNSLDFDYLVGFSV